MSFFSDCKVTIKQSLTIDGLPKASHSIKNTGHQVGMLSPVCSRTRALELPCDVGGGEGFFVSEKDLAFKTGDRTLFDDKGKGAVSNAEDDVAASRDELCLMHLAVGSGGPKCDPRHLPTVARQTM